MSSSEAAFRQGWYLLKTKVREEFRAQEHLENQNFEVYCPIIKEKGKSAPLFAGYLFIQLDTKDLPSYHKIRSTRGVAEFVRFNRIAHRLHQQGRLPMDDHGILLPSPIPNGDQLIEQIEQFAMLHGAKSSVDKPDTMGFSKGEAVLYDDPLFRHLEATFVKGVNMNRGLILINYIESQRTDDGVEKRLVAERTIEIPLKKLQKVPDQK